MKHNRNREHLFSAFSESSIHEPTLALFFGVPCSCQQSCRSGLRQSKYAKILVLTTRSYEGFPNEAGFTGRPYRSVYLENRAYRTLYLANSFNMLKPHMELPLGCVT